MKILYVEDNDDNVYMLKNRLSRAGFNVVVAKNGTQGIAMASSEQPDLILMDLTCRISTAKKPRGESRPTRPRSIFRFLR
jgi:CheY-like chemotaxis protein